ncbi:MAG: hypothetical protein ACI4P4_09280 [Faecousia sp.]
MAEWLALVGFFTLRLSGMCGRAATQKEGWGSLMPKVWAGVEYCGFFLDM